MGNVKCVWKTHIWTFLIIEYNVFPPFIQNVISLLYPHIFYTGS